MFKNRLVRITLVAAFLFSLMFGAMHLYQPMPTPTNENPLRLVQEAAAIDHPTNYTILTRSGDATTVTWQTLDLTSYIPYDGVEVELGLEIKETDTGCTNASYLIVRKYNDTETPWYLHPAVGTDPSEPAFWDYNDVTIGTDSLGRIEYYVLVGSGCEVDTKIKLWGYHSAEEPVLNVLNFGAYNNGTNATTTKNAIQAAIDEAEEHDAVVYLPEGIYLIDGYLDVDGPLTFKGAGQSVTTIRVQSSNGIYVDALGVDATKSDEVTELRDFTLETNAAGGYSGLVIKDPSVRVENVTLKGQTVGTHYWTNALYVEHARGSTFRNVYVIGSNDAETTRLGTAVYLKYTMNTVFDRMEIYGSDKGFYFDTATHPTHNYDNEGITVTNSRIFGTNRAVDARSGLFFNISNNVIDQSFSTVAIYSEADSMVVRGNYIGCNDSADNAWIGVELKAGHGAIVSDNKFYGQSKESSRTAIIVRDNGNQVNDNTITGNAFQHFQYGVYLYGNKTVVNGNACYDIGTNGVRINGAADRVVVIGNRCSVQDDGATNSNINHNVS